jgi:hypothetical protein
MLSAHSIVMAINEDTTVRKVLSLSRDLWQRIEDYRFEQRVKTESEALRRLIEGGLTKVKNSKKSR